MLSSPPVPGRVRVASADELPTGWAAAFALRAKDARYYRIVGETLREQFDCRFLVLSDAHGEPRAVQPFFFVEQDLVAAAPRSLRALVRGGRALFPRLLRLRMLMAGCAAGEGPPGSDDAATQHWIAATLRTALPEIARRHRAPLIVWKDAPAAFRATLAPLTAAPGGFIRLASMPATRLDLGFTSFEDFLQRHRAMRKNLRRKFRAPAAAPPLAMEVVTDVTGVVGELHALYLQVLARSPLQFERLTPEFFLELGRRMPDRARFFLWRQEGRLVAFSLCLVHGDAIYDEYLGLDYRVALDLHLYFLTLRDVLAWSIAQGLRTYHSTPLNYDPKLHLGFTLAPLDLYVRATAAWLQPLLRLLLPLIGPTRAEPVLRRFANASEI